MYSKCQLKVSFLCCKLPKRLRNPFREWRRSWFWRTGTDFANPKMMSRRWFPQFPWRLASDFPLIRVLFHPVAEGSCFEDDQGYFGYLRSAAFYCSGMQKVRLDGWRDHWKSFRCNQLPELLFLVWRTRPGYSPECNLCGRLLILKHLALDAYKYIAHVKSVNLSNF